MGHWEDAKVKNTLYWLSHASSEVKSIYSKLALSCLTNIRIQCHNLQSQVTDLTVCTIQPDRRLSGLLQKLAKTELCTRTVQLLYSAVYTDCTTVQFWTVHCTALW